MHKIWSVDPQENNVKCQGTLPWQPNNVGRSNERGLIIPAFFGQGLSFEKELEYQSLVARINSSDDQAIYTSDINLVGFWPVPPEFTRINCVQQASFGTRVCLSTSPGGSTVMFRYYLLGGDTAAWSRLYAKLCHVFLVRKYFWTVIFKWLMGPIL